MRAVSSHSSLGVDDVKLEYCCPWNKNTLPLVDLARLYFFFLLLSRHFERTLQIRAMFNTMLITAITVVIITDTIALLKYKKIYILHTFFPSD
jgi:hypothetical protein